MGKFYKFNNVIIHDLISSKVIFLISIKYEYIGIPSLVPKLYILPLILFTLVYITPGTFCCIYYCGIMFIREGQCLWV